MPPRVSLVIACCSPCSSMGTLGRRVADAPQGRSRNCRITGAAELRLQIEGSHHLVVFVIDDVAMPHVAWPARVTERVLRRVHASGWVKGESVESGRNAPHGYVLR